MYALWGVMLNDSSVAVYMNALVTGMDHSSDDFSSFDTVHRFVTNPDLVDYHT